MADIKRTIDQLTQVTDPTSGVLLMTINGVANGIQTSDMLQTRYITTSTSAEFASSTDKASWNDKIDPIDFNPGVVNTGSGPRLTKLISSDNANQVGGYASIPTTAGTVLLSVIPEIPESRVINLVQDLASKATTATTLTISNSVTALQSSLSVTATNLSNAITGVQNNLSVTATNLSNAITGVQNNLSVTASNLSNSVTALQANDTVLNNSITGVQSNLSVTASNLSNAITGVQYNLSVTATTLSNAITAGDLAVLAAVSGVSGGNLSNYQLTSEKGAVNGYAPLVGGQVPVINMPYHAYSHSATGNDVIDHGILAGLNLANSHPASAIGLNTTNMGSNIPVSAATSVQSVIEYLDDKVTLASEVSVALTGASVSALTNVNMTLQQFGDATIDGKPVSGAVTTDGGKWIAVDSNLSASTSLAGSNFNYGTENISIGDYSNKGTTGSYNIAIGHQAMILNESCSENIAIGRNAAYLNSSGLGNVVVGAHAYKVSNGTGNTIIGQESFNSGAPSAADQTNYCTSLGYFSGGNAGRGNNNTYVGAYTGSSNAGSGNLFVGYSSGRNAVSASDKIIIDNRDRTTESGEVSGSPIVISTDTDIVNQIVNFNGVLRNNGVPAVDGIGADIRPNGVETPSDWSLSYSPTTRIFSATPVSGTAYWIHGHRHVMSGASVTAGPHDNTTGEHFFYIDNNDNFVVSTSPWSLTDTTQLAYAYYNAATSAGMLFDERHPSNTINLGGFSNSEHRYHHLKDGTQYISGLAFSGVSAFPAAATSADMTYAISSGIVVDEDIWHNIGTPGGYAVPENGPYRVMYRTGADVNKEWTWSDSNPYGIAVSGTEIAYNRLLAGNWSLEPLTTNNDHVNYWLVAIPTLDNTAGSAGVRVVSIPGTQKYGTLALAQEESINSINWGIRPEEFVVFGRITYKRGVLAGTTYFANIEAFSYTRGNSTNFVTTGVSPSDHQSLSNRNAVGAHPATSVSVALTGAPVSALTNVNETLQQFGDVRINGTPLSGSLSISTADVNWVQDAKNNLKAGNNALFNVPSTGLNGNNNIAIGNEALYNNVSGNGNIVMGYQCNYIASGGGYNTVIGWSALRNNINSTTNVALGYEALYNTNGNDNIGIGLNAGYGNTTGTNNVFIGYHAGRYAPETTSYKIIIDNRNRNDNAGEVSGAPIYITTSATGTANTVNVNGVFTVNGQPLVSGASVSASYDASTAYPIFTTATTGSPTVVNIAPSALYFNAVSGNLSATQFTSLSDRNYKENIENIQSATDIISQLQGVSFNWKHNGNKSYGVIAQDIEQVIPETVIDCMNMKSVNYDMIIAFLIESNKELQKRIEVLEGK